jgi:hypothetical protein
MKERLAKEKDLKCSVAKSLNLRTSGKKDRYDLTRISIRFSVRSFITGLESR